MNPVGGGNLAVNTPQILNLLRGARTASEIALRYVMATEAVSVTLSGMSTMQQVNQNIAVANSGNYMSDKQRTRMRERLAAIKRKTDAFCTACGYCMPCPHGVDIPLNLTLYNQGKYFGMTRLSKRRFKQLKENPAGDQSALSCKKCGQCLAKCPNDIPIIDQLAKTVELLG